jgi:hypothetical protein
MPAVRRRRLRAARLSGVSRAFASMDEFLAADPRRHGGDHLELGGWWRAVEGDAYAAAWAPGSGELYIVSHDSGRVKILGQPMDRAEVVRRMDGWQAVVGRSASVEWLLAQLERGTKRSPGGGIVSRGFRTPSLSLKRTFTRPALVS